MDTPDSCEESDFAIKTPDHEAQVRGVCIHLGDGHTRIHDKHGKVAAIVYSTGVFIFKIGAKDPC